MDLAFTIFEYFPFGGLQRDFAAIGEAASQRGHRVDVYTRRWNGPLPSWAHVHLVRPRGWSNHARAAHFARSVQREISGKGHCAIIGFNKMPALDVYFAGDVCYAARARTPLYRLSPRYRRFAALEAAVFASSSRTKILALTEAQKAAYIEHYGTQSERFCLLPPELEPSYLNVRSPDAVRAETRLECGWSQNLKVLLFVATAFTSKGLDRALAAVTSLPTDVREQVRLVVIGGDRASTFRRLAQSLGIDKQVQFLGARNDVQRFMLAADLLLHPAYVEAAGTVLMEAMAAELPVLTTDICGYAGLVREAGAGLIVPSPFQQDMLNNALLDMLRGPLAQWGQAGGRYAQTIQPGGRAAKAVTFIERYAKPA